MLYIFVAIAVVILAALLCFAIFNARKNSSEFIMNTILLSRYNQLVKKATRKTGLKKKEVQKYEIAFEAKNGLSEEDVLNNIKIIKSVEANFVHLKAMMKGENDLSKLSETGTIFLEAGENSFTQKDCQMTKVLTLAHQSVPRKELSREVSPIFGLLEGYLLEGFLLFFLTEKVVCIELNNIFNIEVANYKNVTLNVEKINTHEVDYDGTLPLEDVDFRQEEMPDDYARHGYEIITKVKCNVYQINLSIEERVLKTKAHLMRVEDIAALDKYENKVTKK